jgi:hypothetical protein
MTLNGFAEVLQGFGVDMGDPERRLQKARALLEAGLCVDDAELVFAHVEATSDAEKVPRIVAALALDPPRLMAAIGDARAFQEAKRRREMAKRPQPPVGDKPHAPGPLPDESHDAWERDRRCCIAYCRVVADRADKLTVANELGVQVGAIAGMVERGRELQCGRGEKSISVADDAETQEQRTKRFVEDMRKRRAAQ